MKVALSFTPPIGAEIVVAGFRYRFAGEVPHTRRDGVATKLWSWQAACAECGAEFVTRAPNGEVGQSKRCDAHRKPGVKA